jgi:2-haloacid dehalogenase
MARVLLFDVNETLLDIQALGPELMRIFGHEASVREFFLEVLQHTLALTLLNEYRDLSEIAGAVLRMSAAGRRKPLGDADYHAALKRLTSLPAHPDVRPALGRLKDLGFRLATLTNSSSNAQREQLEYARLT